MRRILIIMGGGLGRFVQATGALADVREHHRQDHLTLLTTQDLRDLVESHPLPDSVAYDDSFSSWSPLHFAFHCISHYKFFKSFDMIYNCRHDEHSRRLEYFMPKERLCGLHPNSKHRIKPEVIEKYCFIDALRIQMSLLRIPRDFSPDLSYAAQGEDEILKAYSLSSKEFVAIVPGSRTTEKHRRWPHFPNLCSMLKEHNIPFVLIGGPGEKNMVYDLGTRYEAPVLYNLPLSQLVGLLKQAGQVIGNDTGPFYLAAACNTPSILLFGPENGALRPVPHLQSINVLSNDSHVSAILPQTVIKTLRLLRG